MEPQNSARGAKGMLQIPGQPHSPQMGSLQVSRHVCKLGPWSQDVGSLCLRGCVAPILDLGIEVLALDRKSLRVSLTCVLHVFSLLILKLRGSERKREYSTVPIQFSMSGTVISANDHTYILIYIYICTIAYMYECTYVCMYVRIHACMHACMHVCL